MKTHKVALFNFAYHHEGWLDEIHDILKEEPWGKSLKPLELYLRANFEIAKEQGKVYENEETGIAVWKPGYLVNTASDPLFLVYKKNHLKGKQVWSFDKVHTGLVPVDTNGQNLNITYESPEFNPDWRIHISQKAIEHIMRHNQGRLKEVFGDQLATNEHLIFRVIYAEIHLKQKEANVIPQWYRGEFQFLMPLSLSNPAKVELTATLQPNPALKQYDVRTLLYPHYAYSYARSVVRNYNSFVDWLKLDNTDLSEEIVDDEDTED
jgi:hypothetical protein